MVDPSEQCDDGNTMANDGCSDTCGVEAGYTCPTPGMACTLIAFCGDGAVSLDLALSISQARVIDEENGCAGSYWQPGENAQFTKVPERD
jgi:cysteine-rich repeat protein